MRYYELTFLMSPKVVEKQDPQKTSDDLCAFLQNSGAIIEKTNLTNKTKLAYPVGKEVWAFLATIEFYCEPENVSILKEELEKKKEEILRYIILSKKPIIPQKTTRTKESKEPPKETEEKADKQNEKEEEEEEKEKIDLQEVDKKLDELLKEK